MGHDYPKGREYFLRHVVYTKVSPFELSVWRAWVRAMKTMPMRIQDQLFMVPFFATTYLIISWANAANEKTHRKNPKDFENDV